MIGFWCWLFGLWLDAVINCSLCSFSVVNSVALICLYCVVVGLFVFACLWLLWFLCVLLVGDLLTVYEWFV